MSTQREVTAPVSKEHRAPQEPFDYSKFNAMKMGEMAKSLAEIERIVTRLWKILVFMFVVLPLIILTGFVLLAVIGAVHRGP